MREDLHVVLLGAETEGDQKVSDRLAYYVFSGTDVRDRSTFADIQECDRTQCTHAASQPVFLSDGAVMYVVTGAGGDFDVLVGKP